jgi:hypothetical protein
MRLKFKQAFLILTNNPSKEIIDLYEDIKKSTSGIGDTFILFHTTSDIPESIKNTNHWSFSDISLSNFPIIPLSETYLPVNTHFPLIDFYFSNRDYDYYWIIEDDVRFSGKWGHFFNGFLPTKKNYDFISSYVKPYEQEPNWYWWDSLRHPYIKLPNYILLRSFNPIYRISKSGLEYIYQLLSTEKWEGHHEVLLPSLLNLEGFSLSDFGGDGPFVQKGDKNRSYTETFLDHNGALNHGTMRFRPVIDTLAEKNKLYHPVKSKVSHVG